MDDVITGLTHASMKQRNAHATTGRIRIIGGRWRGTKLAVVDRPGLRPTSDRVRETLFNWLAPAIPGARVLDLFAGTGALGIEAVSRGARNAVLVEHDPAAAQVLHEVAAKLEGGEALRIVRADAMAWLHAQPDSAFDIAFLDPPFDANLWGGVLPALAPKLSARGWLYVEAPATELPLVPAGFTQHREGHTRDVRFALYRRVEAHERADTLPADSGFDDPATE